MTRDQLRRVPEHSEQVALEVAALLGASPASTTDEPIAFVVAAVADIRDYVCGSLRQSTSLDVLAIGSVALALDAAGRRTPRVLVAAYAERAVLRHLPGVPAVLLSDDVPPADTRDAPRLAPLVVLRGAFRVERLVDVVASLIAGGDGSPASA
jgi:hypothetical protein